MKKIILFLTMTFAINPVFADTLKLPEGAAVDLRLLENVSTVSASEGDSIRMEVAANVYAADGKTVLVKEGTPAKAYISHLSTKARMGEAGVIGISARSTKTIDDQYLPLNGTLHRAGKEKDMTMRIFWLGVLAMAAKGTDAEASQGLILHATTDREVEVNIPASTSVEAKKL